MKRQLDRLKGKRLVTGDPNLMTKDEICINATPNGVEVKEIGTDGSIKDIANGGGEGTSKNIKYYEFIGDLDRDVIRILLEPITEIIYKYHHREDGTYINKCSSGRFVSDCNTSGSVITVFAFIDNVENFYIWGTECKNYKEYFNMYKEILGVEVEFEDLFEEIDKATYDEIFDYYISNINS